MPLGTARGGAKASAAPSVSSRQGPTRGSSRWCRHCRSSSCCWWWRRWFDRRRFVILAGAWCCCWCCCCWWWCCWAGRLGLMMRTCACVVGGGGGSNVAGSPTDRSSRFLQPLLQPPLRRSPCLCRCRGGGGGHFFDADARVGFDSGMQSYIHLQKDESQNGNGGR